MPSLEADILARPTLSPSKSASAVARHVRYHLYRLAGTVVLVAGSWAG
jgi:hypothetical protein